MSKEYLEAFEILLQHIETEADWSDYEKVKNAHKIVEQALHRLESIDNAEPSEALECLEEIETRWAFIDKERDEWFEDTDEFTTIKQALIKAQANARSEEILQKYYEEGITLDSVGALKQERDYYKKVLETIKEKTVDIIHLDVSPTVETYNAIETIGDDLTQEEFDLLKRWLEE